MQSIGPCSGAQFKSKLTQLDKKPLSRVAAAVAAAAWLDLASLANRENGFQLVSLVGALRLAVVPWVQPPLHVACCKYVQLFKLTVRF